MTEERYWELEYKGGVLTKEELDEGWHFCLDWDGLLISPQEIKMGLCSCNERH